MKVSKAKRVATKLRRAAETIDYLNGNQMLNRSSTSARELAKQCREMADGIVPCDCQPNRFGEHSAYCAMIENQSKNR